MGWQLLIKAFIKSILFFRWSGQVLRLTVEDYIIVNQAYTVYIHYEVII